MKARITIRDVPEHVRNELAACAARQGQSMQRFLLAQFEQMASTPTVEDLLQEVERRKRAAPEFVPPEEIAKARDSDRR